MKVGFQNDEEIIKAIKSGGAKRQRAIRFLYNSNHDLMNKVIKYVKNNTGNEQDGQDMFHEGIIVLDRNIRNDKFRGESALVGYLFSICRLLWMNQIRKKGKIELRDDPMTMDQPEMQNPEMLSMADEKRTLLNDIIKQLGDRCQKILEMWKLSYSMQEIADKLGFSSATIATKNKYKCHKSLMNYLKAHPQLLERLKT